MKTIASVGERGDASAGGGMNGYQFREFTIPDYMMDGLRAYIEHGIEPGSFLSAVISNDLREAISCADDTNIRNLPAYVAYLYNEAPSPCWGSAEKMQAWAARFAEAA